MSLSRASVALLLLLPLAGCLGVGGDGDAPDQLRTRRDVAGTRFGAIDGVVTDSAVRPVRGANVTVVETNETFVTDEEGFFRTEALVPGAYTIHVRAPGFVSTEANVVVAAGETVHADFLLVALVSGLPYTQAFESVAFFELAGTFYANISGVIGPYFAPVERCDTQDPTDTNDALGLNACGTLFFLEPPIETVVYELSWEPASPLSSRMVVFLAVQRTDYSWGVDDILHWEDAEGPINFRVDRPEFERVSAAYLEACEGGDETYCGYGFWDQGWPLQSIIVPSGQCTNPLVGVCGMAQQQASEIVTVFYNAPAPEGFSIRGGTAAS